MKSAILLGPSQHKVSWRLIKALLMVKCCVVPSLLSPGPQGRRGPGLLLWAAVPAQHGGHQGPWGLEAFSLRSTHALFSSISGNLTASVASCFLVWMKSSPAPLESQAAPAWEPSGRFLGELSPKRASLRMSCAQAPIGHALKR